MRRSSRLELIYYGGSSFFQRDGRNALHGDVIITPLDEAGSATRFAAGFVGDLSLFAGWQITPYFAINAGWDFLWVAGIATALRQFNLDNARSDPIDPGGRSSSMGSPSAAKAAGEINRRSPPRRPGLSSRD